MNEVPEDLAMVMDSSEINFRKKKIFGVSHDRKNKAGKNEDSNEKQKSQLEPKYVTIEMKGDENEQMRNTYQIDKGG